MEVQCLSIYVAASDAEKLSMNTISGPGGRGVVVRLAIFGKKVYV